METDNKTEEHRLKVPISAKSFIIKKKPFLFGLLTFFVLTGMTGLLTYQRFLINKEGIQKETFNYLESVKEKLQDALVQGISAAKVMSFFIQQDGAVKNFDSVAAQIISSNKDIDVLQLVPDGIIRYVYPLEGNESVLGYDILKESTTKKEALKAIQKNELFYAGPFQLKQGGMGIVGRLPVIRNGKFWGFSAVIIKLSTLLKAAGIDSLNRSEFYVQLSKTNPETGKEEFFVSYPREFVNYNPVSIIIPVGDWKLSAIPLNTNEGYINIFWLTLLGILFSVMGGVFVFMTTQRPERLNQLINSRTTALQESEEKYRSLIEQASDGIIVYSFDGSIHQFNKRAYTALGYTRDEFAKLNLKDLLVEKKMTLQQSKADDLNSGKTAIIQRQLNKKDGSLMDIEINVSMLPDSSLLAFVRDITDRKNAERALKESEQKFSRVFQSDHLGLAIYDSQNQLKDVNECFAAMFGATPDELSGKTLMQAEFLNNLQIKNKEEVLKYLHRIMTEKGRLSNFEIEIEKQDGESFFLLISVEPLELNNQPHWLTTAIDITEKKKIELSLLKSEIKYRSLIEQASDGIIITDLSGIIMEVNKSICSIAGYNMAEMTGRHIQDFLPRKDITELPLRIEELIAGKALLYERRLQRKDGTIIDVEVNSKMTLGNSLIGFVRDITERKRADDDLKKSNERFELIAKATNDAIWDHSFITNETVGNENLYNLYGFTPGKEKIDFKLFESRMHPDEQGKASAKLQNAIKEKSALITEEFRFKTTDGVYKNFYNRAYIQYDDQGNPARILGVMQDISKRILDKQKLLKEKELSDSIINSLPAVFYMYNKEGKFIRWNKNFEIVTGYSSEEMKSLHPLDLFDGNEKILLDEKIQNVFAVGRDSVEANFLTKDGKKIPYYFTGMRIDYEGEICLLGFGLDFSDKMQSDKLIKDSEQKFRSLVEQASDGVAILSDQGNPLYISPSVKRILGYTEAESMHLNLFELIHPEDKAAVASVFERVLENPGIPIKGSTSRILHKNGEWRWLEDTITNMLHIPAINGIVENFRDVTEKLQIEKKIIGEKELSDTIINSLPGIFYLYDHKGSFIRWNKNFEDVTGYNSEEIGQMHPLDFYDEDIKPLLTQRIENVLIKRMPGVEYLLFLKDGRKIPFYFNSIAIEYEGEPSIVVMGFDVTERKKAEQELLVLNRNLEQKASELKSSYVELERFAYIVSHDLQEPLRMVSSFLKLLEQKYKAQLDDTADKYIHFAVDGADRMKQLIMDLLEYSRTGTNKEIAADTDMNEVMVDVVNVLENSILEQNAVVEFAHLPILPETSKIQMFQLMQNLISNALKYHSEKKPVIKIDVKELTDQWVFSVADNGIGIDPKYSEKIFIIFQRLHNKNEFSGTGIGLSICKKIVEKHGGKIWMESIPDHGSTFFFSIPKK